jgi:hypothetical protein
MKQILSLSINKDSRWLGEEKGRWHTKMEADTLEKESGSPDFQLLPNEESKTS